LNNKILRKELGRSSYPSSFSKKDLKREGKFVKEKSKENPSKDIVQKSFNKRDDIKCFKCLGHGHVKSQCPFYEDYINEGPKCL